MSPMRSLLLLTLGILLNGTSLHAARTTNLDMPAVPVPTNVVIDGNLDDWDRTGGIWLCTNIEKLGATKSAKVYAMFDREALYVACEVRDPTPMVNQVDPVKEAGQCFRGDAVQLRFWTEAPQPVGPGGSLVSHLDSYYFTEGKRPVMRIVHQDFADKKSNEGVIEDALADGAALAFRPAPDGKGYTQEMRIPWQMIRRTGDPLVAGNSFRMAVDVFWGGGNGRQADAHVGDLVVDTAAPREQLFVSCRYWGVVNLLAVAPSETTPSMRQAQALDSLKHQVRIAHFYGNRDAAVTFTFDDNIPDQFQIAAPLLEKFGFRGTFFVIPGKTPETDAGADPKERRISWAGLKDLSCRGHEIGNHSWSHPFLVSPQTSELAPDLENQVEKAHDRIREKIGVAPLSFCYPMNHSNDQVRAMVMRRHLFARESGGDFEGKDFSPARAWAAIDHAMENGLWWVTMTHAITPFANLTEMENHFNYLRTMSERVWVDTMAHVGLYERERDAASLQGVQLSPGKALFTLAFPLDPEIFNAPLTVIVPAPGATEARAVDATGARLLTNRKGNDLLVEVRPAAQPVTVTVTWSPPTTADAQPQTQEKKMRVTCSWDDAHRDDVRLAEILRKHKAKGTFFIYPENYVLYTKDPEAALKKDPFLIVPHERFVKAYDGMEVGAHGFQHPDMRKLTPEELWFQLTESKRVLEEWFRRPIVGMAYPNGAYNPEVEEAVRKAGYTYSRTVEKSPSVFPVENPTALKVSVHFKDAAFWDEFERVKKTGGVFYFWGHSYEIKDEQEWRDLEDKVQRLSADPSVQWVTNAELFKAVN